MAVKTLIEKADKVIEVSLDVMLEGLREKAPDKDAHIRISDANTSCNSANNTKRQIYSGFALFFRAISKTSPKEQKKLMPELLIELQGAK